ncbi:MULTISPECIES: type I secretion system permease/ATPase [Halocynthiibacter]|uniref:ATP-binding cassette domain-containing protein n=1 Tax=Halocynthiibacter halioticoli TaxID=2986804 RepID=A0AAE3J0T5_9RHOB|nr:MULTISPECIES: ATP-binding cassette domain-containing protein [Halocynthiibacter]MCV6825892.1 ATP-binding cassette domain-containing protein [Halocynthiibacter halioticoli]MCW4058893.1 ATP-binding cassette domain-containing protein [Halocynthiibacter sp. SDUM655004]
MNRRAIIALIIFGSFTNLLALTGPFFMLFVYDRVLSSGSIRSLVIVSIFALVLFCCMGVLDFVRARILSNEGDRIYKALRRKAFEATILAHGKKLKGQPAQHAIFELETLRSFIASGTLGSLFDAPWSLMFLMALYVLHPWFALAAALGGIILLTVAFLHQSLTRQNLENSARSKQKSDHILEHFISGARTLCSLNMGRACYKSWAEQEDEASSESKKSKASTQAFKSTAFSLRQVLQSGMIALGAVLVLAEEISAGAMVAGSILIARFLAPLETAISGWNYAVSARDGLSNLSHMSVGPKMLPKIADLKDDIKIENVTVLGDAGTAPRLNGISFQLKRGSTLGIIGPNGSGKSTLIELLTGSIEPDSGRILNYAPNQNFAEPSVAIGYLPQQVTLFPGTIAENISRFEKEPEQTKIEHAAKNAGIHNHILSLPFNYETNIQPDHVTLSRGELQRVAFARSIYGNPEIVLLDEPDAGLDHLGIDALNASIRKLKAEGKTVVIATQRPSAVHECDHIIQLSKGNIIASGPRESVLRSLLKQKPSGNREPMAAQ